MCAAWVALALAAVPARATIRYDVSLDHPGQHLFHITMSIPDVKGSVVIQIPAWNGLYQIQDFGYHMMGLHAFGSAMKPLHATRLDKQTWRIDGQGEQGNVRVEYASYWDEPGPFGTQLNAEHAFLNLAMVLCYIPDRRSEDTEVHFADIPQGWRVAIELPKIELAKAAAEQGNGAQTYAAPNYDALVDAPTEIGQFDELMFQAAGRPIRIILHGEPVDHTQLIQTLSQIVEYESRLMGGAPFKEYMFLYRVGRGFGGGGMEHANSTAISVTSAASLANVSAHEFFHLWNVKRIRPQTLEPVNYSREMWTPSLWFAEGVTNTYAAYTLVRTGLWSKEQFLEDLGNQITELEMRPAHRWQSAEESSLDAWLEKYPLYNSPDFSISYYNKGQLIGLLLDIVIRDATDNRASLDDVMRRLNTEYAQQGRFYPDKEGIAGAAEEVLRDTLAPTAPLPLGTFFDKYVSSTDELPFDDLLGRAGLVLKMQDQRKPGGGTSRVYTVTEMPNTSEKQARILSGLLHGTTAGP